MSFDRLEPWLQSLLEQLTPGERRNAARELAQALRQGQRQRIAAQLNPDGSPYAPRKPRLRAQAGRIRRSMFAKMRGRYLQAESDAEGAYITITGRAARIALVHQEGREDAVSPRGPRVRYAQRQILGLSNADENTISEILLAHLARRL